eukprot:CAMPEP_0119048682 /NCGR_PEP_ID=MMETSP1177-20130426/60388_1 /TAXON_ID=2985 /ORGANISM="Ochromonas sp, Strain CCMP1899" /LENGTH=112 /DNA_ID=CAMNT_0007024907 /DNA_START=163 /DNA_END=501 /DNA_ORIENTATION=-
MPTDAASHDPSVSSTSTIVPGRKSLKQKEYARFASCKISKKSYTSGPYKTIGLDRGEGVLVWLLALEVEGREGVGVGMDKGELIEDKCSSDCMIASTSSPSNTVDARRSAPG